MLASVHLICFFFCASLRELVNQLEVTFYDKSKPMDHGFTLVLNQRMTYMEVRPEGVTGNVNGCVANVEMGLCVGGNVKLAVGECYC